MPSAWSVFMSSGIVVLLAATASHSDNWSLYLHGSKLFEAASFLTTMGLQLLSTRSPIELILWPLLLYITFKMYKLFFTPLFWIRNMEDLGYVVEPGRNKRDVANEVRKRRARGDLPPVYPNGWFRVLESWQLKIGEKKDLTIMGEHIAVFRGESGEVFIVDAYCPHMGANVAIGGRVLGDCIECPFHGWVFRGEDGKCVDIPYTEKVPDFAKIRSWSSLERNGMILMWYDAEGRQPHWTPPIVDEVEDGSWTFRGFAQHHINAHIEEIPENGGDVSHLHYLHGPFMILGVHWSHIWDASWHQDKDNAHIGVLNLTHRMTLLGIPITPVEVSVQARQVGPGLVFLHFKSWIGDCMLTQHVTPVEPLLLKVTHTIYGSWTVPTFIAKFFLFGELVQFERDVMVWNNKRWLSKPLLVKEDQLVAKHRRWYSQFYSENSPRFTFNRTSLDW
uniref:cholesterol 7-desaturase n=1 Tax=Saccoglossus kowalevskii TaxID=10224 RepID=A0ABM0MQI6_SACKO|nr:PREDICTED: cholesterol desaturase daf-36-like [Saccoglossus kowalevskii]